MVQDEFEMENQGYEEETSTRPAQSVERHRSYLEQPSSIEVSSRLSPIVQANNNNIRTIVTDTSRNEPETHVYEDIIVSPDSENSIQTKNASSLRLPSNAANITHICHQSETSGWPKSSKIDDKNARNLTQLSSLETDDNTKNFHRNLTLPLRRTIGSRDNAASPSRFSVRVTNRERTRCSGSENDSSMYDSSHGSERIGEDRDNDDDDEDEVDDGAARETSHVVDKPGRRRRKKDCKHCKSKANGTTVCRENRERKLREPPPISSSYDATGRIVRANNEIFPREEKTRLSLEPVFSTNDENLPIFNPQRPNFDPRLSPLTNNRNNSIFSISNNVSSACNANSPKPLNYDKNETDVRLVSVELTDDRALITPQKNRTGMKVNSIYSQEQWRNKDVPIFVTDVKEQTFQRAYSLPTRTQTPSSQNRVNLRRSVRGEPPPHPARLRKNRHGWTLHFARPLDGTGCTRSIVLLLIAILALLGIGGIALYIVFEPEKLQIIQQYLRSSTPNATRESNSTMLIDSLNSEANIEIATLPVTSATFTDSLGLFPQDTTFSTETDLSTTITEITLDLNVTRHCDDCYETEVCVALVDEEVPICRIGPDTLDPTGCNGLCLINKQKCHRLDFDAFRCVEVEHYCLDDEWTCSNTLCIPLVKHCDGHMNCYDHSDEYDCACDPETHFQCGNETSCLPLERRCDGKIDCWDATDEINCTLGQDFGWSCPSSSEFTCSNGECILKARFCDGLRDCTDGSDEPHGCQGRCNKHEFSCLNGRCITKGMKCNGIDDCGDDSDEQHCRDRIFKKPAT